MYFARLSVDDESLMTLETYIGKTYVHLLTRKQLIRLLEATECKAFKKAVVCYAMFPSPCVY